MLDHLLVWLYPMHHTTIFYVISFGTFVNTCVPNYSNQTKSAILHFKRWGRVS
jgi:hypothetical protein